MPTKDRLEWTFDTVAADYEKLRPGYVDQLYQTILIIFPSMKTAAWSRWEAAADRLPCPC